MDARGRIFDSVENVRMDPQMREAKTFGLNDKCVYGTNAKHQNLP